MAELSFNEQERIARQLESIEGRFEELSIMITRPEIISDAPKFASLMREHSDMAEMAEEAPVGRNGQPEDVAKAMAYLADADFVTGQVLPVNGGYVI